MPSLINEELFINDKKKQQYVRKYLRKDPIKTRGQLLEKFNLSEDDLIEIENYLNNKKVSVKPTKLGLWSD